MRARDTSGSGSRRRRRRSRRSRRRSRRSPARSRAVRRSRAPCARAGAHHGLRHLHVVVLHALPPRAGRARPSRRAGRSNGSRSTGVSVLAALAGAGASDFSSRPPGRPREGGAASAASRAPSSVSLRSHGEAPGAVDEDADADALALDVAQVSTRPFFVSTTARGGRPRAHRRRRPPPPTAASTAEPQRSARLET